MSLFTGNWSKTCLPMERRTTLSSNIYKTKEVIMVFRKKTHPYNTSSRHQKELKWRWLKVIRFLGLQVTDNISWTKNLISTLKKAQQRLHFSWLLMAAGLRCHPRLPRTYRTTSSPVALRSGPETPPRQNRRLSIES